MPARVLIILPCFNEEHALPVLLNELRQVQHTIHLASMDVVVVNDCSTDDTAGVARRFAVPVLMLPVNLGIGGAMQTGYRYALENGYDAAIQLDGDGQHPPQELLKLLHAWMETHADIVIGSRFIEKAGFQSSWMRRLGIRYLSRLNQLLTYKRISDTTSGYRLFGKKAIALAAAHYPDEYPEPESLVVFAKAGLKVTETPVVMRERQGGTSSIRNFVQLYYIVKVTIAMCYSYIRK